MKYHLCFKTIYRLRKLETSISKKEKRQAMERKKREIKKKTEAETALPSLNAHKVPIKQPDFVPPEQLSGDLRSLSVKCK